MTDIHKLVDNINSWANEKGLTDPYKQSQELDGERIELMEAIDKGKITDIKDEIGDNFVVPIVLANCYASINILECHRYASYLTIEPKVYDHEWMYRQLQDTSAKITDNNYYGQNIDIKYNLGKYFTLIRIVSGKYHTSLEECLQRAYEKISKRTGKTVGGKFVKD